MIYRRCHVGGEQKERARQRKEQAEDAFRASMVVCWKRLSEDDVNRGTMEDATFDTDGMLEMGISFSILGQRGDGITLSK